MPSSTMTSLAEGAGRPEIIVLAGMQLQDNHDFKQNYAVSVRTHRWLVRHSIRSWVRALRSRVRQQRGQKQHTKRRSAQHGLSVGRASEPDGERAIRVCRLYVVACTHFAVRRYRQETCSIHNVCARARPPRAGPRPAARGRAGRRE